MVKNLFSFSFNGFLEKNVLCQACVATWRKYMPFCNIKIWTENDEEIKRLIETPFGQKCFEHKEWGLFFDYVKYSILYKFGGMFFELDQPLYTTLGNEYFESDWTDVFPNSNVIFTTSNGPCHFLKGSPLLKEAIYRHDHFEEFCPDIFGHYWEARFGTVKDYLNVNAELDNYIEKFIENCKDPKYHSLGYKWDHITDCHLKFTQKTLITNEIKQENYSDENVCVVYVGKSSSFGNATFKFPPNQMFILPDTKAYNWFKILVSEYARKHPEKITDTCHFLLDLDEDVPLENMYFTLI